MDRFYSLCLQGDINAAMEYLGTIQPKTNEIKEIETRYQCRFFSPSSDDRFSTEDEWIRKALSIYYDYFRTVLTKRVERTDAEAKLNQALQHDLLKKSSLTIEETEDELASIFTEKGYYFLGGVTQPFRGPYIWQKMDITNYKVEIPLNQQSVTVYMMSDFILESWISYATFGEKNVGGWAKGDGLYCNAKCYEDLTSDAFQISYLKHEAQHLHDYQLFPFLDAKGLEYRAKLVELIYFTHHQKLANFISEAKNDPLLPHSYASYLIVKNLSFILLNKDYEANIEVWLDKDYGEISSAAKELFMKNTSELENIRN